MRHCRPCISLPLRRFIQRLGEIDRRRLVIDRNDYMSDRAVRAFEAALEVERGLRSGVRCDRQKQRERARDDRRSLRDVEHGFETGKADRERLLLGLDGDVETYGAVVRRRTECGGPAARAGACGAMASSMGRAARQVRPIDLWNIR